MKKILAFFLAFALVASIGAAAFAEVDLSGMSYDELVALKDQINLAIWNSAEWQEVTVPYGAWIVGEDIPAGKWTITAGDGCSFSFKIGTMLNSMGTELEGDYYYQWLTSKTYRRYDPADDVDQITVDLRNGQIVFFEEGSVVFTPYAGKPGLGFK